MPVPDEDLLAVITPLYALSAGITKVIASKPAVNRLALLQVVAHAEGIRPSQIADALGLHQSQITRQIQVLQEEGLLVMKRDPHDRRSRMLAVTEAGEAERERLTAVGMTRWRRFVEGWEPAEVRELGRLLSKLHSSITDTNARPPGQIS